MGQGPAKFPRDEATPDEASKSRAEEKIRELEEARRAGTISDEDFENERARLLAEGSE
jgi:hypothetical protein